MVDDRLVCRIVRDILDYTPHALEPLLITNNFNTMSKLSMLYVDEGIRISALDGLPENPYEVQESEQVEISNWTDRPDYDEKTGEPSE